jgi:predicted nucleic acid-binding protein
MSKYLIVNSSPIIILSKAKLLFLLLNNKENLIIPNDVYREVIKKESDEVFIYKDELLKHVYTNYVIPNEILSWGLGKGESSVIATGMTF